MIGLSDVGVLSFEFQGWTGFYRVSLFDMIAGRRGRKRGIQGY